MKAEVSNRNEELAKKQKLLIEMDEEVAKAFHSSVNISSKATFLSLLVYCKYILIDFVSYSIQWKQCSPVEDWLEKKTHSY